MLPFSDDSFLERYSSGRNQTHIPPGDEIFAIEMNLPKVKLVDGGVRKSRVTIGLEFKQDDLSTRPLTSKLTEFSACDLTMHR